MFYFLKPLKQILVSVLLSLTFIINVQAVDTTQQEAFIERFYQNILNRTADSGGMTTWLDRIETNSATDVALGFFRSTEFNNLNLSNEEFVDILYQTLFDRQADISGKLNWLLKMDEGRSKESIMFGFFNSQEFKNLADSFDVMAIQESIDRPSLERVELYVDRFYRLVLKREYDESGFHDWVKQLNAKTKSPVEIAQGFLFSAEYGNQNEDNDTFLETCYQAFFGRASDITGKSDWLDKLNNQGYTKQQVFDGFAGSQEFANLVDSFNLNIDSTPPVFISSNTVTVDENQTEVITIKTTDESEVRYVLSGLDKDSFNIDSTLGVITFNIAPDYETKSSYSITVRAIDTFGNIQVQDLSVSVSIIRITLEDIRLTVSSKGNDSTPNFGSGSIAQIIEEPLHGMVEAYLVGNEVPYIKYTSSDCFIGSDSFIYKSGDEYGRVNITINNPSSLSVLSETKTLNNTGIITGEFLRAKSASENVEITTTTKEGVSSLTVVGNEIINYNYDPIDSFVGNDYFEYSVSEIINECSYSKTGRIDFIVESLAPVIVTPTEADFRTLLSSDNPKDTDQFGSGVAIEGNTIVVGVPGYQIDGFGSRGEVVIYNKTESGAKIIQHIQNPDLQILDFDVTEAIFYRRFGYTVSLKDGFLAIAAPGMQTINNRTTIYSAFTKVYVYKQEEDNTFTYLQTFDDITNNNDSYFAYNNIAINKNYLVIGARNETVDGTELAGAAYIYPRNGEYFSETPTILSDVNLAGDGFANKVALMDDLVLISLPKKKVYEDEGDTQRYGAVYVYKNKGSGLEQVSVINSPKLEVDSYAYSAYFGSSLAVDGSMLAIGIPNATVDGLTEVGYVDVYMRSGDSFALFSRITDSEPVQGENFGSAVAIENPYLIVSSTSTSNSNNTSKADTTQVYQYSGGDTKYIKLDEFEHIPTYRTWLAFQERASFGAELDISDGTIISSSEYAFNFSKLQSRSYRAGQAYLLEVDIQKPYWLDYKANIVQPDDVSYFTASISKPDTIEYISSGVGADSALFTYDMNSISYGITTNVEECFVNCEIEGGGEECFLMCEEQSGNSSQLDFYTPMDTNGDNKYEVDMKLSFDGKESIYPLTWEVKDKMNVTEGHNDGLSYSSLDYNRLQLEGVGSTSYATELLFQDEKAYVRSNDSIFIYRKNLNIPELLENYGKISISDVPSSNEINTDGVTSFYKGSRASFDVEGSRIATMSMNHETTIFDEEGVYKVKSETDSYIHLFDGTNYIQSIVVHKDNQNIFPCEDDKVCDVNHKNLLGVQLEEGMVFVAYQNQNSYHNDTLISHEKWEVQNQHHESGVMIYKNDGTNYNLLQTIQVPASSENTSSLDSFRADGDFLLINGHHSTDDYYSPNRYIRVYKFDGTQYSLLQSFDLPTQAGINWTATVENGYVLIENQRIGYTNLDTYIYQYDINSNSFVLIDTITNEEAGATYTDGFKGVHIQVDDDGAVYLFKRFNKRLEPQEATTDFVGNAAYIGIFKQDETSNKFRFVDSFTHRDGSAYFANSFAIEGDIVISNTSNREYLHSFRMSK